MTTWLPIRYREFYDFPRSFVVDHGGASYLFDCVFGDEAGDYPATYQIYRLAPDRLSMVDETGSWAALTEGATRVGEVPTAAVQFDQTRRWAVQEGVTRWLPRDASREGWRRTVESLRNRYYNPQTGTFTQPDPIGIAGGLNVYGFAAGDPVT